MEILIFQNVQSLSTLLCNETRKTQNIFDLDVHSANPANPVLPFTYFTVWERAKPRHCALSEGQIEASRLLHLPGAKTRSNFLLTPFPEKTGYIVITKTKGSCNTDLDRSRLGSYRHEWKTMYSSPSFSSSKIKFLCSEGSNDGEEHGWVATPLFAHLFRHCFSYSPLQIIRE